MSSKFKKGIKEKLPVNILAMPETIHEKETATESVLSGSCVRRLEFGGNGEGESEEGRLGWGG